MNLRCGCNTRRGLRWVLPVETNEAELRRVEKVSACSLMFAYWQHCVAEAAVFLGFEGFLRCLGLILAAGVVARGR